MKKLIDELAKYEDDRVIEQLSALLETGRFISLITGRYKLGTDGEVYESFKFLDTVTFMYVREGTIKVTIEKEEATVAANSGICIKMGVGYKVTSVGDVAAEVAIVIFHQSAIFGMGTTAMSAKYRNPVIYAKTPNYSVFNCRTGVGLSITKVLDDIWYFKKEESLGWELAVKGSLCYLWYLTIEMYRPIPAKAAQKRASNDEFRIKKAIDYIDQHYMDTITLDEIAESIHISKSECCRCFKRVMDLSPIEYIMRLRIYTAAAILGDPASEAPNISDLATATGHNNISYFIKTFKKYMGVTPKEYREQAVKNSDWVAGGTSI